MDTCLCGAPLISDMEIRTGICDDCYFEEIEDEEFYESEEAYYLGDCD